MAPIDPHVVAPDARALREGAWPRSNPQLRKLAELARLFGPHFWLMEGAVAEVRGNVERNARKATQDLAHARRAAERAGFTVAATASRLEEVLAEWDTRSATAIAAIDASIVPHTTRPVSELFNMAVARTAPFADTGAGFRDAVIYLSLVDEMHRRGFESAILVTSDTDFRGCASPITGQQSVVMSLGSAIENFEQLASAAHRVADRTREPGERSICTCGAGDRRGEGTR